MLDAIADHVRSLNASLRRALTDSGLAATRVRYAYSFTAAEWLVESFGRAVDIDWPAFDDTAGLDEALRTMIAHCEEPGFEEATSTRRWFALAKGNVETSDLAWFIAQLRTTIPDRAERERLYDGADVPHSWHLSDGSASRTHNRFDDGAWIVPRRRLGRRPADPAVLVARPLRDEHLVPDASLTVLAVETTRLIASQSAPNRKAAVGRINRRVARSLGVRSMATWTADERRAFDRLAPVVGLLDDLDRWPATPKRALVRLIRAKGGRSERDYVVRLRQRSKLRRALVRIYHARKTDR